MATKHHPRINPQTPPLQRFFISALIAAALLGLSAFLLSIIVRVAAKVPAAVVTAPNTLLPFAVALIVGLVCLYLGVRVACKSTWTSEAFYQWMKPGGYHWKFRGKISAVEARDARRLMRVPSWATKAGLTREEYVSTTKVTDAHTGEERLKDRYDFIYPRANAAQLNEHGVLVFIAMPDGTGILDGQPNKTFDERLARDNRLNRIKHAARLQHKVAIHDDRVQLLSRVPAAQNASIGQASPLAASPTYATPAAEPTPLPPAVYDYKREVLRERYDESQPVRNWLLYKLSGQDCDKIALSEELTQVLTLGFHASPDSMHSFWTTYKRAIQLWYGETFTLSHPTNNVQRLLDLHDQGAFAEVNALFAPFATLAHARGNFMLMPVYADPQTGRPTRDTNLNLVRNKVKSDYWDLTLAAIQNGEFRAFFGDHPVAPQFNIPAMSGGFADFVARYHLEMYFDQYGTVRPLWAGHLAPGAKYLPQTQEQVVEFVANACAGIEERTAVLAWTL
ncbi:MAG: hypothetical protein ACK5LO_03460 [Leucobacter sp.]